MRKNDLRFEHDDFTRESVDPIYLIENTLEINLGQRYCKFKGVEVELSLELFNTFLKLAKNKGDYIPLDKRESDMFATEREKTWVKRINKQFKATCFLDKPIIISKELVGYKINENLIKYDDIRILE